MRGACCALIFGPDDAGEFVFTFILFFSAVGICSGTDEVQKWTSHKFCYRHKTTIAKSKVSLRQVSLMLRPQSLETNCWSQYSLQFKGTAFAGNCFGKH